MKTSYELKLEFNTSDEVWFIDKNGKISNGIIHSIDISETSIHIQFGRPEKLLCKFTVHSKENFWNDKDIVSPLFKNISRLHDYINSK